MECEICGGTGFQFIERFGVTGAMNCQCRQAAVTDSLFKRSGIPKAYGHCHLQTFDVGQFERDAVVFAGFAIALLAVEEYASNLLRNDPPGLLLCGPRGSGKTHLATGILRLAIQKGRPAVFLDCGNLLQQVKDTFGKSYRAEAQAAAMDEDLVVLDDLGAQMGSDWERDTIGLVVAHRYNEGKATIVTTSVEPAQFGERLGERIGSRLNRMCTTVRLPAYIPGVGRKR